MCSLASPTQVSLVELFQAELSEFARGFACGVGSTGKTKMPDLGDWQKESVSISPVSFIPSVFFAASRSRESAS